MSNIMPMSKKYSTLWWPMFLTGILGFLFNLTDSYLVASIDEAAVAAVGLVTPIIIVSGMFTYAINASLGIFIGQAYGAKRMKRLKNKIFLGHVVITVVSFVFFVLSYLSKDHLFAFFNASENIADYFVQYYGIWIFTIAISGFSGFYSTILNAIGEVRINSIISVFGLFVNAVVSYVLINGKLGFPTMGIEGAAVGTLFSSFTVYIILFFEVNKTKFLIWSLPTTALISIFNRVKHQMGAQLLQGMVIPLGLFILTWLVSNGTDEQIAAFTLAHRVDLLWFAIMGAFGGVFSILANYSFGQKDITRVKYLYIFTLKVGWFIAFLMFAISFFISDMCGSVFFEKPLTQQLFSLALPFTTVVFLFWHFTGTTTQLFNIIKTPIPATKIVMARATGMYVVGPSTGYYFGGFEGLLWGYVLGLIPALIVAFILLKRNKIIQF
jgi:Na+-driven multidrug efflux pump